MSYTVRNVTLTDNPPIEIVAPEGAVAVAHVSQRAKRPRLAPVTSTGILRHEQAFLHYVAMSPPRTLARLTEQFGYPADSVRKWSSRYGWQARLTFSPDAHDVDVAHMHPADLAVIADARAAELQSGLALDYVRVAQLKTLAEHLHQGLVKHGVWYQDARNAWHIRAEAIRVYRELLADIAAELGARVKRVEILDESTIRRMAEDAGVNPDTVLKRLKDLR